MENQKDSLFVSFKRRKNGALFLVINTQDWLGMGVRGLVRFFQTIDRVTQHKALITSVAGMGLGLGFSLMVFSQPTPIQADIPFVQTQPGIRVTARELRLPSHKVATPIIWEERSAGLSEPGTVLIKVEGSHPISSDVQKVRLGESIKVIGSNNGIYSYTVIATRELPSQELNSVLQNTSPTLVVYTPIDFLGTRYYAVVARPTSN